MMLVFFLTTFTYITSGEPNKRAEGLFLGDSLGKKIFNIVKPNHSQNDFYLQKEKQSAFMQNDERPATKHSLPKCCDQSKSKVDDQFHKLKKSLKIIRSCRAKNREKTCGSTFESMNNAEVKNETGTSNISKVTLHDVDEIIDTYWPKAKASEIDNKNHSNKRNTGTVLPAKCLYAIVKYLDYYGRGAEEIEDTLGEFNLDLMEDIKDQLDSLDLTEKHQWPIATILSIINTCQYDAIDVNDYENESICYEIKQVIRSNYDTNEHLLGAKPENLQ